MGATSKHWPCQQAVTSYRRLAEANPDSHLPDLVGALSSLATCLADADRREQARAPAPRSRRPLPSSRQGPARPIRLGCRGCSGAAEPAFTRLRTVLADRR